MEEPPGEPFGDEPYVNATKAAELLRIAPKTMLRWIQAGRVRLLDKRYDHYSNAEFLIPLSEIERLRAALTMSQRELVTRLLKVELDHQRLAEHQMRLDRELIQLRADVAYLRLLKEQPPALPTSEETPRVPFILLPSNPREERDSQQIPLGSVRLVSFLHDHQVKTTTGLDHLSKARITPILVERGAQNGSKERWLTQNMQAHLIVFWDSASKPYVACSDCPHRIEETDEEDAEAGEEKTEQ